MSLVARRPGFNATDETCPARWAVNLVRCARFGIECLISWEWRPSVVGFGGVRDPRRALERRVPAGSETRAERWSAECRRRGRRPAPSVGAPSAGGVGDARRALEWPAPSVGAPSVVAARWGFPPWGCVAERLQLTNVGRRLGVPPSPWRLALWNPLASRPFSGCRLPCEFPSPTFDVPMRVVF